MHTAETGMPGPPQAPQGHPGPLPAGGAPLCASAPVLGGPARAHVSPTQAEGWGLPGCHSLLPVSQLFEALRVSRQAGASPSESDQLLHFASNGQLCGGTERQPHSSMATRLLLGNSHWGSAGTAPLRGIGVAWPQGLWNGAQNYSDTFHFSVSFVL